MKQADAPRPRGIKRFLGYVLISCIGMTLVGCAAPTPQMIATEVTRVVVATRPVEVTRLVTAPPVVVTRLVEATRVIRETRLIEVTRAVVVTATPAPTLTAKPTSAPAPQTRKSLQPEAVIAAFHAAGLEAENVHRLEPTEYKLAPYVGWGLRFMLPSHGPDYGGRVFYVENAVERGQLRSFYEEMGKASAILASHLFERENVLLQIPGDVPLERARQYEAALMAAKNR